MYQVKIFNGSGEVIEVTNFDNSDEAQWYYQELVMRQNCGEKKLDSCSFTLSVPKEDYDWADDFIPPEPDYPASEDKAVLF